MEFDFPSDGDKEEDKKIVNNNTKKDIEVNFTELILCGICFEQYDSKENKPIILECGHTICQSCLTLIYQKVLRDNRNRNYNYDNREVAKCPFDKRVLKYQNPQSYPINYSYLEIVSKVESIPGFIITQDKDETNNNNDQNKSKSIPINVTFSTNEGDYRGEYKNTNIKHGYGRMNYKDGSVYTGYFFNDKKEGYGKFSYNDGSLYIGNWKKGKHFGLGKLIYRDGSEVETVFIDENHNGEIVKKKSSDNSYFVGKIIDNKIIDKAYQITPEGNIFYGHFDVGEENKLIKNDEDFKIFYKDGKIINCKILDDNFLSEGHILYENGDTYNGGIYNGYRHGIGTTIFANGAVYTGSYVNDKKFGCGKYEYDGYSYDGEYKNDLMNGSGIESFKNGEKYIGEFLEGKKDGKGIYIFQNGKSVEGIFKCGELIEDLNKKKSNNKECLIF